MLLHYCDVPITYNISHICLVLITDADCSLRLPYWRSSPTAIEHHILTPAYKGSVEATLKIASLNGALTDAAAANEAIAIDLQKIQDDFSAEREARETAQQSNMAVTAEFSRVTIEIQTLTERIASLTNDATQHAITIAAFAEREIASP